MSCVVCGKGIFAGQEQYANAWEKSRKLYPCCSTQCCKRFSVDEHWIPAVLPDPANQEEQARLLKVFRNRLGDGDRPTVVLREMLLAGVSPLALKKVVNEASVSSYETQKTAKELTKMGLLAGLLTGHWSIFTSRDKRDPKTMDDAFVDLDRWERKAAQSASEQPGPPRTT